MNEETIKKWEKIFNENKDELFKAKLLYEMSCNENYNKLSYKQKESILNTLYYIYLKDETNTDASTFADILMNNYKDTLSGKIDRHNIYEYLEN